MARKSRRSRRSVASTVVDQSKPRSPLGITAKSRRRRVAAFVFCLLLVSAWVIDLPGRSFRALASRAMHDNRPHAALQWLQWADRTESFRVLPPDDQTLRLRALALLRLNLSEPATEALKEAERRRGDLHQLRSYLDLADAHGGDPEAVKRLSEYGADVLPPQAIYEATVRYAQYHGRFAWAVDVTELWHQEFPDDGIALYHRGRMDELRNRLEPAAADYRRALELQPWLRRPAFRLGMVLKQQGHYEEAEEYFRRCQGTPYESIARIELAECLWQRGESDAAWQVIEPELAHSPHELADAYLQVDEFNDRDRAAVAAARIRESQDQLAAAIELWERVLAHNRRSSEALAALAAALRRVGRTEEADKYAAAHKQMLEMMRRCAELRIQTSDHPEDLDARVELAELYFHCESLASAQLVVREVLAEDPNHRRANRLQAEVYREVARTSPEFAELAQLHERRAQ